MNRAIASSTVTIKFYCKPKIQKMEDITINQKYTVSADLSDFLNPNFDENNIESRLLIQGEYIKCLEARHFLKWELSTSYYQFYNIDICLNVRTKEFTSKIDYSKNFSFCMKMKEKLSYLIKAYPGSYERYLIYVNNNDFGFKILESGNYRLQKSHEKSKLKVIEENMNRHKRLISPTISRSHLRIVV